MITVTRDGLTVTATKDLLSRAYRCMTVQGAVALVVKLESNLRWTRIFGQVAKRESRSYKLPRNRSMT